MNFDWIISPLTIYGVFAAGGAAALHLVLSTGIEMRRQQKHGPAGTESPLKAIDVMKGKVQEVPVEVKQNTPPPVVCTPFTELNVQNRAEALRMYQRGSGSRAISVALGLPPAEVALLEKVHYALSGGASS